MCSDLTLGSRKDLAAMPSDIRKWRFSGLALEHIREQRCLTQSKLADASDTGRQYISQLENGDRYCPSLEIGLRLASALGVSPTELGDYYD